MKLGWLKIPVVRMKERDVSIKNCVTGNIGENTLYSI